MTDNFLVIEGPFEVFPEFDIVDGRAITKHVVVKDKSHRVWFTAEPHLMKPVLVLIDLFNDVVKTKEEGTLKYSKADIAEAIRDIELRIAYHSDQITEHTTKRAEFKTQSEHLHRAKLAFDYLDELNTTDAAVKACP